MGKLIRSRSALYVLAGVFVVFLVGSFMFARLGQQEAQTTSQQVAAPLAALCTTDPDGAARVGADCVQAIEVAKGKDGDTGPEGRGVLGTTIRDGRLIVAYSDGTTQDAGLVAQDGKDGPEGRGIVRTKIVGSRLVAEYTDGLVADLGPVVGPAGRGVASMDGSTGRLVVTYTDGTLEDLGPLPPGPAGKDGSDGADGAPAPTVQRQTFLFPDGSSRVCDRTGGPDDAPEFRCGDRVTPPTTTPSPPTTEGG